MYSARLVLKQGIAVCGNRKKSGVSHVYLDGTEILNGYFPVLLALQSQLRQIHKLFITNKKLSMKQQRICDLALKKGIEIQYVDSNVLQTLSRREDKERGVHQGICADVSSIPLERVSTYSKGNDAKTDVFLCGIKDPFNLGTILRSSYYLGINDVLISHKFQSSSLSPVVSKASAGTLEIHPPKMVDDPTTYFSECIASGGRVIGVDSKRGLPPRDLENLFREDKILILGNEGEGIPHVISELCTDFIQIPPGRPLHPDIDSLNVSTASAILMNQLLK